ncbi:Putative transcriptional regulator, TetR family [Mycobacteroides abscessus subsp. abscessus]|nr:Putative transcriptional regulator, TetR family [Mycobacteroides abscessus subsp. abscessus]
MPYVESAQRTKEAVAAARIVLMREGVGRTTMRAVAAEAGIPLGTLQYVFPRSRACSRRSSRTSWTRSRESCAVPRTPRPA